MFSFFFLRFVFFLLPSLMFWFFVVRSFDDPFIHHNFGIDTRYHFMQQRWWWWRRRWWRYVLMIIILKYTCYFVYSQLTESWCLCMYVRRRRRRRRPQTMSKIGFKSKWRTNLHGNCVCVCFRRKFFFLFLKICLVLLWKNVISQSISKIKYFQIKILLFTFAIFYIYVQQTRTENGK